MIEAPTFDIILDYDDVIYPLVDSVHRLCIEHGIATESTPLPDQWDMAAHYGVDVDTMRELWQLGLEGDLYEQPYFEGAVEQMQRLVDYGNRVHIVTARGFHDHAEEIRLITKRQVEERQLPHHSLHFAKDKAEVARELGATFAVDDAPHNYEALRQAGVVTFLMDAAHNQHVQGAARIRNLREFADLVLSVSWV